MYCSKCGKQIADDALFCDGCGAKVGGVEKKEAQVKEGKTFKCPYCGEILPFDALKCPSCGHEIRGRETTASVQSFFDKLNNTENEDKKIELIKTYPIPNNREDILEFMYLAVSNFDAKYYATNKNKDSVASAWRTKIEQCYQKGKAMLTSQSDLARLDDLYKKVNVQTSNIIKMKTIFIVVGFIAIALGVIIVAVTGDNNIAVGWTGIALLAGGIVLLVFGFKRKKTNKELEEEKIKKEKKRLEKANKKKQVEEEHVIHETVVRHEYVNVEAHKKEETHSNVEVKVSSVPSKGSIEVTDRIILRAGEKILLKQEVDAINEDEDYYWKVTLTNQALYYIKTDEDEEKDTVTRIPLDNIIQVMFEKGNFMDGSTIEIYREGSTDKIEGNKKLEALANAINEQIKG